MARGRVITPDFWTDGTMIGLTPWARLFYIGLWNFAFCDKGHLPDDAIALKLKVLPADPVDAVGLVKELMTKGKLVRLSADGKTFLWMPTFEGYQKADSRWKTRCPACALQDSLELTETQESLPELTETHQSSALREENLTEENTREKKQTPAPSVLVSVFDEAWTHWPKKVERKQALDRFKAAVKRYPGDVDHLAHDIAVYGDAYAATTERQFVPALGVWLAGDRWTDELPQTRNAPGNRGTRRDSELMAFMTGADNTTPQEIEQ